MTDIQTIKQMLERNAEEYRAAVAFQMRGETGYRRYTFAQVAELAARLQGKLEVYGVGKGDRVAIISENRPEWSIAFLAVTAMGAVAVPLDALLRREEMIPLLDDSEAKVVILSQKLVAAIQGTRVEGRAILMENYDKISSFVPRSTAPLGPDDLASIVYTSGTTGSPKGVMLTHGNLMFNVVQVASLFDLGPGDNFLSVLPLHHTFENTAGFLGPFYKGCCITYAESLKSYNLLRNMQETGVTVMCGVPLLYQLLIDGIRREVEEKKKTRLFDLLFSLSRFFLKFVGFNIGKQLFGIIHKKFGGKIRFFVTGGAAIDPGILRDFELMGFTVLQGYGLTESAPILTACNLQANRLGSVGKAIPGVQVKIAGNEITGEILAAGPNIMKGYYKRKDLTDEVLKNGWLYTGDVGYLDEDGYLFITGRSKDEIVTASGVNVYPDEIEQLLNKLAEIKESCVLPAKVKEGIRKGSEEVLAVIVPNEGIADEQVRVAVNDLSKKLAEYKRIAKVVIRRTELPKTRLLKVKRFAVRKELGI